MKMKNAIAMLIIAVFLLNISAFASLSEIGDDYEEMYYDFEETTVGYYNPLGVYDNWMWNNVNLAQMRAVEEDKGKSLALYTSSEADMAFPHIVDEGILHMSFDVKFCSYTDKYFMFGFYTTMEGDRSLTDFFTNSKRKQAARFDRSGFSYLYSENKGNEMMTTYDWQNSSIGSDTEWHRIDVLLDEISDKENSCMRVYFDKQLVNTENKIPFGGIGDFRGAYFFCGGGESGIVDPILIDNVKYQLYKGSPRLMFMLDKNKDIELDDTELKMNFKEDFNIDEVEKDDIIIKRDYDDYDVSDFEIADRTDSSITVKINEKLVPEMYKIKLADEFVGDISQKPTMYELFTTKMESGGEYQKSSDMYCKDDFNNYTESGTIPSGWTPIRDVAETYIESAIGSSGDENDRCMAIKSDKYARRYALPFCDAEGNDLNTSGEAFGVSFKVKYLNTGWNLSFLEKDDMKYSISNRNTYLKNVAIGVKNDNSELGFTNERTDSQNFESFVYDETQDNVVIEPGVWHDIELYVFPTGDGTTKYTVSVDGKKSTAISSRDLSCSIYAIAFGNVKTLSDDQELYIDDVECYGLAQPVSPYLSGYNAVRYDDTLQSLTDNISSATKYIDLTFITPINTEDLESKIKLYADGNDVECNPYTIINGGRTVRIEPVGLLSQKTEYTLYISPDVSNKSFPLYTVGHEYVKTFKTLRDAKCIVNSNKLNVSGSSAGYLLDIVKTDNSIQRKTIIVASYTEETDPSTGKTYKLAESIDYQNVDIGEDERGIFTFDGTNVSVESGQTVKGYVVSYPDSGLLYSN